MQFVVLSDALASDYVGRVTMPIFRDDSASLEHWREMDPLAAKHDTVIYDAAGQRVLYRRAESGLATWKDDVAAAVRALPP